MTTFTIVENAKNEAGVYAAFWETESPIFKNGKYGVVEQWKIEQFHGFKPEGSFSLIGEK